MISDFLPILTMLILVVLFASASFVVSSGLAPKRATAAKKLPYECGIIPESEPVERFPVKFYLVAIAFIVLDVEIVFLYPFTTIYRALGAYGLGAMGVFLLTLLIPFAYLLSSGALQWAPKTRVTQPGPVKFAKSLQDSNTETHDNDVDAEVAQ